MTVIAFDGKTLAADKRSSSNSVIHVITKIHRIGNLLVAHSGPVDFGLVMVEWVRSGRVPEKFPASQRGSDWAPVLVIEADGSMSSYNQAPYPIRWEGRFGAIGSGREYALAAMHLGKTAAEAVAVACALDPSCGNGIDTLTLQPP